MVYPVYEISTYMFISCMWDINIHVYLLYMRYQHTCLSPVYEISTYMFIIRYDYIIMAPKGGHIVISVSVRPFVRPFVTDYFCWWVVVCVRFSSETTRPISPMMIPINWGNIVDVQRALHFDLDPSMTAGQGHEILRFCELFLLTGSSLCSLLLRNYSTDFSNDDTNQLREHCRCATCT